MIKRNTIDLPPEVEYVIRKLNSKGYDAFTVGGCVRDVLLGRKPEDWDITTSALPEQVKEIFDYTIDTGIKHGTVTVRHENRNIEVTTYRVDGTYRDARHPDSITFTASLEEDLKRRDFTINAMAFHPERGIIDLFGGMADLDAGIINAVGNAKERFSEDALRMLRAVRFSAQLGFRVSQDTMGAIRDNCRLIQNISKERIRDELTKLLTSDYPIKFILLRDSNLLQYVLPEFEVCFHTVQNNPHHIYNVAVHSLKVVEAVRNNRILRWAALLHDIGKPFTKSTDVKGIDHFYGHPAKSTELAEVIMKRLKFDNQSIYEIKKLIYSHDMNINPTRKAVRKAASKFGRDMFPSLLELKEADRKAQAPEYLTSGLSEIRKVREIFQELNEKNELLELKDLLINGKDLIEMGLKPGPVIGKTLEWLLERALEDPEVNTREKLIAIAKQKTGIHC